MYHLHCTKRCTPCQAFESNGLLQIQGQLQTHGRDTGLHRCLPESREYSCHHQNLNESETQIKRVGSAKHSQIS